MLRFTVKFGVYDCLYIIIFFIVIYKVSYGCVQGRRTFLDLLTYEETSFI